MSAVTVILDRATQGEAHAAQELLPLVYEELRKLAATRMADEPGTHTLQPTALVHEAWLRLVGSEQQAWKNRAHFFAAAGGTGAPKGGAEGHQTGHGYQERRRPLRRRAASGGPDGPSQHRQGAGC